MHKEVIICMTSNGHDKIATGDVESICRVWNDKLEMVYEISKHR